MKPGLFLSLDGLDGTGKSTQCTLLCNALIARGLPCITVSDPGGTRLGGRLRTILLEERHDISLRAEALLFLASRAELTATVIRPALEAGTIVIADRFLLSNIVYQGHAGGLAPGELRQLGLFSTGGLQPDQIFILDLPVEEAIRRRSRTADRMESRAIEFHQRVREGFLKEAALDPQRIQVIEATGSVEEIQSRLLQMVQLGKPAAVEQTD